MAIISAEVMQESLAWCYQKALQGGAGFENIDDLAAEYAGKYPNIQEAAEALIANQAYKCGAAGFITGLGGFITLPAAIPANLASTLYIQLRMIAAIAKLVGCDPHDDAVQTMAYLCLTGSSMTKIAREAGIKISQKMALNMLKKLPGAVLIRVNKLVGFRLITKFGTTGIINLVKVVPLAGGIVGGGFDLFTTKKIGAIAMRQFLSTETDTAAPQQPGQNFILLP